MVGRFTLLLWLPTCADAGLVAPPGRVLLYVDPGGPHEGAETAAVFTAAELRSAGITRTSIIELYSAETADALCRHYDGDAGAIQRVRAMQAPAPGCELQWAQLELGGAELMGVLCGSDGGLASAERLQHVLVPARSNGIVPARRDKCDMNAACRAAGMRVAAQATADGW